MGKIKAEKMTPIERSIRQREGVIERMERRKQRILKEADEEARRIDKSIAEKKVLLDALKKGQLAV